MALLNSGFNIDNPNDFTNPLQKLINVGFGLDREEPVEEIEIEIEPEEEQQAEEAPEEEIKLDDLEVEDLSGENEAVDAQEEDNAGPTVHDDL